MLRARGSSAVAEPEAQLPGLESRSAELSPCGLYRYTLERRWDDRPPALFVMLNPSTADASEDDPTIRRCIGFARDWGYGGLLVGNLYAYRATDPAVLWEAAGAGIDPVGPLNDRRLRELRRRAALAVAAWGAHKLVGRAAHVMDLLGELHVLRLTKHGQPGHPLYVPKSTLPTRWQWA